MKKFTILAAMFLLGTSAFAQRYEYGEPVPINEGKKHRGSRGGEVSLKQVRFGAFLAPTSSWMKPTANKSDDKLYLIDKGSSQVGFAWGLMIDYFFAENYGIATGFQINRMSGGINATLNPAATQPTGPNIVNFADFTYKVQYLEVPFGLKLRSDDLGGGIRIFGQLGVSLGITLSKKATYSVTFTDTMNNGNVIKNASGDNEKLTGLGVTPLLFQMNVGGGVEYAVSSKMSVYAALLFNNGFAPDVTNPKELDLDYKGKFSDGNVRMNNIALRLGLFF
jgi:opacity protein-like surface antigen